MGDTSEVSAFLWAKLRTGSKSTSPIYKYYSYVITLSMNVKHSIVTFVLSLSLTLPGLAFGQICGISEYPYGFASEGRPITNGGQLLEMRRDLPFIENDRRNRYSEFWVTAGVLNIRSGPGLQHGVLSQTYFGNHIFVYAKRGDWVAITKDFEHKGQKLPARWINIKFLSPRRITNQVDIEVLKGQCGFEAFGRRTRVLSFSQNKYDPCFAVYNYLMHQNWLSKKHVYSKKYEDWRQLQQDPDLYWKPHCGV